MGVSIGELLILILNQLRYQDMLLNVGEGIVK